MITDKALKPLEIYWKTARKVASYLGQVKVLPYASKNLAMALLMVRV